jgi:8-oxo-dGTP pyrophosphatase MutT (NUDIX family)
MCYNGTSEFLVGFIMLIGKDVSASVVERMEGSSHLYRVDVEGTSAIAYMPMEGSDTIKGRAIATFNMENGEKSFLIAPYGAELYRSDIMELIPGASNIACLYEKSCGAVVFMGSGLARNYLLIENRRHNWGFPKGHMECGEEEMDTAAREIYEETGLTPKFIEGFRESVSYYVRETVRKTSVYYIAESKTDKVSIPAFEISSYKMLPLKDALEQLTYRSERALLMRADEFLTEKGY